MFPALEAEPWMSLDYQAEDRIHPPRKRIGVSIIILDHESEALKNLVEKQRIFNESVAKFA